MKFKIVHSPQTTDHRQLIAGSHSLPLIFLVIVFIVHCSLLTVLCFSQGVSINTNGTSADISAILDISSSSQGLLIPRMTTSDRNTIASPAESLLIFNTTTKCLEIYVNGSWNSISCPSACTPPSSPVANNASDISCNSFTAIWNSSAGASAYYLDVSTDAGFSTFIAGYNNLYAGNVTSIVVTGLSESTDYYYRVRAYNICVSSNSNTINRKTTACNLCNQVWASANANVGTMIISDGSHAGFQQSDNNIIEKYCYNNDPNNCNIYGGMYEWGEAMQYQASVTCNPCSPTKGNGGVQGICDYGYHIPSDIEWSQYEYCVENNISPTGNTALDVFQTVTNIWRGSSNPGVGPGDKMKATSPDWDGTNTSGFTGLPGGYRQYNDGSFSALGTNASFWSATEYNANWAGYRVLDSGKAQTLRNDYFKMHGFSVRCLKD
jgi:uncharacterized protein (TIGR02145 family)